MDPKPSKIGPPAPRELAAGAVVDGRYKVVRKLGAGGTSTVYEVEHNRTGRHLAMKMSTDPSQAPRLEQEARATARLRSSRVARVVDLGNDRGTPYLVMTLLEGTSMRELLAARKKLDLRTVANVVVQLGECLDEAHGLGLVHRDLKPDNVHLHPISGTVEETADLFDVTLLDFGVVKVSQGGAGDPNLTQTGSTVGTPYYMSLEQLRGSASVDVRSDIYSLSVMLYESFAGAVPFTASTLGDLVFAIISAPPVSLTVVRPEVPREVSEVIMRGLSSGKEERPASMREIAKVFAPHADPAFSLWLRRAESRAFEENTSTEDQPPAVPVEGKPPSPAAPPRPNVAPAAGPPRPAPPRAAPEGPLFGGAAAKLRADTAAKNAPSVPRVHADADTTDDDPPTRAANVSLGVAAEAARAGASKPAPAAVAAGRDRDTPTEMFVKGIHQFDAPPLKPKDGVEDPAFPTMNLDIPPNVDLSDATAVLNVPLGAFPPEGGSGPQGAEPPTTPPPASPSAGAHPVAPDGGYGPSYPMMPPQPPPAMGPPDYARAPMGSIAHGIPQPPPSQQGFGYGGMAPASGQAAMGEGFPSPSGQPLDGFVLRVDAAGKRAMAKFRRATPGQQALVVGALAAVSAIFLVLFVYLIVR